MSTTSSPPTAPQPPIPSSAPDASTASAPAHKVDTLLVTVRRPLSRASLERLAQVAHHVHSYPDADPPASVLAAADVLFCSMRGLPACVTDVARQMPRLRLIQFVSSGVDRLLASPAFSSAAVRERVVVANASGLHVTTIPPYVLSTVLMLYLRLHHQYLNAAVRAEWIEDLPDRQGRPYAARSLRGKTVGLLGYGALGRETARLFAAMGARIVAANTHGTRTRDDAGYVMAGTGDVDCLLPEQVYATDDEGSFDAFLERCDVLVASLPSTPRTDYMLQPRHFRRLPRDAVFVNVGRGSLVRTETLLEALDRDPDDGNGALLGVVVDVTDPEPLPKGSALFRHPNAIVTPHLSGNAIDEYEIATDICCQNAARLASGATLLNVVDLEKGY
ncbi:hypothetical protein ACQY0O_007848 [Thecaphora frezii]